MLYRLHEGSWQEYRPGTGWDTSFHAEGQILTHPDSYGEISRPGRWSWPGS